MKNKTERKGRKKMMMRVRSKSMQSENSGDSLWENRAYLTLRNKELEAKESRLIEQDKNLKIREGALAKELEKYRDTESSQLKLSEELKIKESLLEQRNEELKSKEILIDNLLHEIRKINSNLSDSIDQINFEEVPPIVQDIWAQANLMSIRLRLYDYEVNPNIITSTGKFNLPVYKKIHKIIRTLKETTHNKNITYSLDGKTFLAFRGHDILEIAFYIILENAVKYSQPETEIKVEFRPNDPEKNALTVNFINVCDQLPNTEEINRLTEYRYRGENATEKGDGIGLHTLKTILDLENVKYRISVSKGRKTFHITLTFFDCTDKSR